MIGQLVGRQRTITMLSGPEGVVYSVHGADGRMLASALTESELRQALPDIYQQVKSSVAVGTVDHSRGMWLDASVRD